MDVRRLWPRQCIVPVVRYGGTVADGLEVLWFYGTAFFINSAGGFMTAKHVLETVASDVKERGGQAALVRTTEQATIQVCPIIEFDYAPDPYDVAVGRVGYRTTGSANFAPVGNMPDVGGEVNVIGYPEYCQPTVPASFKINDFRPTQFKGIVSALGAIGSRDPLDPVLELDFDLPRGVSGSPVFAGDKITAPPLLAGVCIGNQESEYTIDVDREEILDEQGKKKLVVRQVVRRHIRGYAHSILFLLSSWRPNCFSGALLGGEIWAGNRT